MKRQWIAWVAVAVCVAGRGVASEAGVTCDWRPGQGVPGVDRATFAMCSWDPDGAGPLPEWLVVGGNFSVAGDLVAKNIAAWDGRRWHALGGGIPYYTVSSLTIYQGDLVAGTFGDDVYRFRDGRWQRMGGHWGGSVLLVWNDLLFAAGRYGVLCWDGTEWSQVGTFPYRSPWFTSLCVYDGDLIAAGQWSNSGEDRDCILRWDGQDWLPLGDGLQVAPDADEFSRSPSVVGMAVLDGELVAAGNFHRSGDDATCRYVARWDGYDWQPFGAPVDFLPEKVGIYGGQLVLGAGSFPDNSGRRGVTIWNGHEWEFLPGQAYDATVLYADNSDLVIGGCLSISGVVASGVARWDGDQWHAMGSGFVGNVIALGAYDGELILAGWFPGYDSGASSILRGDNGQWRMMGSPVGRVSPAASAVYSIFEYDEDLLIAGEFQDVAGMTCNSMARWNGQEWEPFGGVTVNGKPATIWTMFTDGEDLYVAGSFDTVGGVACNSIARWDGTQWHDMGANMAGRWELFDYGEPPLRYVSPSVRALAVYDGQLIAGGFFALGEGEPYVNIARWDGQAWQPMGDVFGGEWSGVECLAVYDGRLIVGGYYVIDPYVPWHSEPSPDLLAWDGETWQPLGRDMYGYVSSLVVYNGELVAAGSFGALAGTGEHFRLARWDGQQWDRMDEGILSGPYHLLVHDGDLVVAGVRALVDGKVANGVLRWGPRRAGDVNNDTRVDVVDLLMLARSFGSAAGEPGYNEHADFNGDGTVDALDLQVLAEAWE